MGPVPPQPRRADARDGHRRGARLHVRRVRQGPADEAQPRDPPPARPAARQRPRRDRADDTRSSSPCPAARSSTTATRSPWATTSTSATATASARRCSGPAIATAASRRADFAQLYAPPLMDPVYGFQAVNVEAQLRTPYVAAALAAAVHRPAQGPPRLRARQLRAAAALEPPHLRPPPHATRTTSCSASTTSPARPRPSSSTSPPTRAAFPMEMFGRTRVPPDRRAPLPADARPPRLLLVSPGRRR